MNIRQKLLSCQRKESYIDILHTYQSSYWILIIHPKIMAQPWQHKDVVNTTPSRVLNKYTSYKTIRHELQTRASKSLQAWLNPPNSQRSIRCIYPLLYKVTLFYNWYSYNSSIFIKTISCTKVRHLFELVKNLIYIFQKLVNPSKNQLFHKQGVVYKGSVPLEPKDDLLSFQIQSNSLPWLLIWFHNPLIWMNQMMVCVLIIW